MHKMNNKHRFSYKFQKTDTTSNNEYGHNGHIFGAKWSQWSQVET